jgi:hypothetical protein
VIRRINHPEGTQPPSNPQEDIIPLGGIVLGISDSLFASTIQKVRALTRLQSGSFSTLIYRSNYEQKGNPPMM